MLTKAGPPGASMSMEVGPPEANVSTLVEPREASAACQVILACLSSPSLPALSLLPGATTVRPVGASSAWCPIPHSGSSMWGNMA